MRINTFLALATGMSRRAADGAILAGSVYINNAPAKLGQQVSRNNKVTYGGELLDFDAITAPDSKQTIMINKPVGYVVSRQGQGSRTIYELLPKKFHALKPVGRLDKASSGLLLLTNDGPLAQALTHPSTQKTKVYIVMLDKPLRPRHSDLISTKGVQLEDGMSSFRLEQVQPDNYKRWRVLMYEGRNRQIRRTFRALGYEVRQLHRVQFGEYHLGNLPVGKIEVRTS